MKLLLDFPTIGEPHYAQAHSCDADPGQAGAVLLKLAENSHPYVVKERERRPVSSAVGKNVHVRMTAIRSHFAPDNIEGVQVGDTVLFHVTNLEQDWDMLHGFAVDGSGTTPNC